MSAYNANPRIRVVSSASRRPSALQVLAITMEGLLWRRRAQNWDDEGSVQLTPVVAAVLDRCEATGETIAVDLGCGSGQVTLPLARKCLHVMALDLSQDAIELLKARAEQQGIENIHALTQPIETFELAPESVDLVVSNYALHHLRDRDKTDLVRRSLHWLRPGGRIVIGDMMLGRGTNQEDRAVIREHVRAFAKRGPAGWWRIVKNVGRFLLRVQEKPLSRAAWEAVARRAGFADVRVERILAEACVLTAHRPEQRSGRQRTSARALTLGSDRAR